MLLPLLLSAAKNAADTTHKIDFAQKLESFSDMSLRQMVEHVTGGVISIAIKICIAVAVYFIGRWLIRYIRRIMGRMMERRQVDPSLRTFLQNLESIPPRSSRYSHRQVWLSVWPSAARCRISPVG